jgi:hypothetical protein
VVKAGNIQCRPSPALWVDSAPFDPRDLPGLALMLDYREGVLHSVAPDVPAQVGDTVRRWLDLSGNARQVDQPALNSQPILRADGIEADGVDDYLFNAAATMLSGVSGWTMCLSLRQTSPTAGSRRPIFVGATTATGVRGSLYLEATRVSVGARRANADAVRVLSGSTTGGGRITMSAVVDFAATSAKLWLNGVSDGSDLAFLTDGLTSSGGGQLGVFGNAGGTNLFGGIIAAVAIYDRPLSESERVMVEAWLP